MKRNYLLLVLAILLNIFIVSNVFATTITVDGHAYLENQTNHSGIEIYFKMIAPSDSNYTVYNDSSGYYNLEIENGFYDIIYSKDEYFTEYLNEQIFYSNTTISDITLLEHTTILYVPLVFSSIQSAIDYAWEGDTVLVQPDTYVENINYNGKNIVVSSLFLTTQNTSYISQTIIDGNSCISVVTFENGEDSTAILCGFTITNGYHPTGGGIYCYYSSPSITNVTISENSANDGGGIWCSNSNPKIKNVTISNNYVPASPSDGHGGGIYCKNNSSPTLVNVVISNNSSNGNYGFGGGIYCIDNCNPILDNVTITNNSASNRGGGIYCMNNSSPSLENLTITGNSAYDGGGISCYDNSSPSLENVTITGNSSENDGGGIYCSSSSSPIIINSIVSDNIGDYGIYVDSGNPSITYSDFYNNENGNFYNCGQWVGVNVTTNANGDSCDAYYNIQLDPLFIDPLNGDYHLSWVNFPLPDSTMSPCIDAGDPDPIYNDPDATRNDMGAYYFDQTIVSVDDNNPDDMVLTSLFHNYPNPFSSKTIISYYLPKTSNVKITIYNIKGQLVKTLFDGFKPAGYHTVDWNVEDMSSGIYFYKLCLHPDSSGKAGDFQEVKKMILLR